MKWLAVVVMVIALGAPVPAPVSAQGRGAARPQVIPPSGPLWTVIRKNCTSCHGIDDYAFFAQDRAAWQNLIETRHKVNGGAAGLSNEDRTLLLDWLSTKFGPNTKPFPRSYIAPEITTFFSDPEGKRLLDSACTTCHPLDRVENARYPEEKWRVTLVDMRERGARISDEELEHLVEWLGRVRGTNQDK